MIIYIDTQTLDLTTEGYVPLTDMALVRGDKIPLRIILKNGLGIDTESQEAPVLAVKKSLGNDALVLAATGLQRVEDALGAAYVGSLVVNTAQLAEAMGGQDRIDLVGEVVLVAPDGAQRTSRLIRVTVRADLLPGDYEPPAEVLADWNNLVDASLAARLPDALHDAGVYLAPVPGAATLTVAGGTLAYALGYYMLPLDAPAVIGHLAGHYSINRLTITAPASHNNGTAWGLRLWRYQDGTMSELGTSTDQATWGDTDTPGQQTCSWEFSGVEVAAADVLVIQVYDRGGSSKQMQGYARQMDQGTGMGICSIASGSPQITHPCAMGITLDTTYQDGVSVGGTELASKSHFDALAAEVRDTLPQVNQAADDAGTARDDARAIAEGLTISTGTITTGQPGSQAAASLRPGDAPGSWVLDMTIPQGRTGAVDTAQAYVWTQPQTYAAMINANGGVNIPLAAGAAMDTASVNRAYAMGMAQAAMMHQSRTYWLTSSCTATNGVTINHVAPGCYCTARIGDNSSASLTMQTTGVIGGANYGKILGYTLPIRHDSGGPGAWFKLSMLIGSGGQWAEYPNGGIDDFRFRPAAGSTPSIARLVEVTFYYDGGHRARVRELIGNGNPRSYVVRTTESRLEYDDNTNPSAAGYRLIIAQSELSYTDDLTAGVWLVMGGASDDTVIKLADIRGWDTYHLSTAPVLYMDAHAPSYGCVLRMEAPTVLNGIGNNTYVKYGLTPFQRSWIISETEAPYADPDQPTA